MTDDLSVALEEFLRKRGIQTDFIREALSTLVHVIMEIEAKQKTGASRYERTTKRITYRNGYRIRAWDTRVGRLELRIPKLRRGSYYPSFLEPRRRAEKALLSVIQEAYVHGVSTRKVEELVRALGLGGISKSEVSRVCAELDKEIRSFLTRPLTGRYPYVWLDAMYVKVREEGRVVNMALVIATGVKETGEREFLGLDVGLSESEEYWTEFLRGLVARGLGGVLLVISDAHEGLRQAIAKVLQGASWQRCRVHFMRNLLAHVPKAAQQMVAAMVRTIFAQPDQAAAKAQLARVAESLRSRYPKVAGMLLAAEEEVLAYMAFPPEHWRQIHSTNPLERLNAEFARRFDVVGIFPNREAAVRLAGAVAQEQQDEWLVSKRRYFSLASMAKLYEQKALTNRETALLAAGVS